jgi:DNA-binding NarL/FixJ family response regulator
VGNELRVLMVDDDPFTRATLASSLQVLGCFVLAADSVSSALKAIRNYRGETPPNVALLDLDLGEGPTGLDLAHTLQEEFPDLGIVLLSTYQDPRLLGSNQPEIPIGSIYLVKNSVSSPQILADALNKAVEMAQPQGKKFQKSDNQAVLNELTDKQIEMMRMVASGLSNSEIAKRQWMTEAAVEKAITRLIKNLKLTSSKEQNQRVMIASAYHQFTGSVNVRTDN